MGFEVTAKRNDRKIEGRGRREDDEQKSQERFAAHVHILDDRRLIESEKTDKESDAGNACDRRRAKRHSLNGHLRLAAGKDFSLGYCDCCHAYYDARQSKHLRLYVWSIVS